MTSSRDLDFLYEIGSLRNVPRGWRQHLASDCASDLEHMYRVVWLALLIARREHQGDENKILKMAFIHDLPETRVSDLSYVQKVYTHGDEERAAHDLFENTRFEDYASLLHEFEQRECIESKIVKDADNLDIDLELKELEERGHKLPEKWKDLRKMVREEKLYTHSAKQIWDEIQISDPSSWHLTANKWLKIPSAGK